MTYVKSHVCNLEKLVHLLPHLEDGSDNNSNFLVGNLLM